MAPPSHPPSSRTTVLFHLRDVRGIWIYVLLAAIGLGSVAFGGYQLVARRHNVTAGVMVTHKLTTSIHVPSAAQRAGVQPRDHVEALDGRPVSSLPQLKERLQGIGAGQSITLRVRHRDGSRENLRLTTATEGIEPILLSAVLVSLCYVLSGLLLFWFNPGGALCWVFLGFTLTVGLQMLAAQIQILSSLPALMPRLRPLLLACTAPLAFYFFVLFPTPLALLTRHKRALQGGAVLWALMGLFAAITPVVEQRAFLNGLLLAVAAAAAFVDVGILIWRRRRKQPPKAAAQLRALSLAMLIAFVIPPALEGLRTLVGWVPNLWSLILFIHVPLVAFPALVGYTIARHDLFAIDRMVARAGAYSAAALLLALGYGAVVTALPSVLKPLGLEASPAALALIVLGGVALLRPVKTRIQERLDRAYKRRRGDPETKRRAVREALRLLVDGQVGDAFGRVEELISESFGVDGAQLLIPAGDGWTVASPAGTSRVEDAVDPARFISIITVRAQGEVVGGLGIGRSKKGRALAEEDMSALELVAQEASRRLSHQRAGETLGGYRLVRFLAQGGMGSVWLGTREGVGGFSKPVAIKQLLSEGGTQIQGIRRFLDEARLAARLVHPNIVQIEELGETDDGYFIVMEYVPGIDLYGLLEQIRRAKEHLPISCAAYIATGLCRGLDFAHNARDDEGRAIGLVHRDVSPQNVLLSEQGAVKLTDFGIAQVEDQRRPGELAGKTGYLSPEQLRGDRVDHRVDIFAAGIVLYELCTGLHPFRQPGRPKATWSAIQAGRYLDPAGLRAEIPSDLVRVIDRALSTTPARRYQTAQEMADAVQQAVPVDLRTTELLGRLVQRGRPQSVVQAEATITRGNATEPTRAGKRRPPTGEKTRR